MTDRPCPIDGAGLPDGASICPGCVGRARGDLRAVPGLLRDLDATIARQAVTAPGAAGACRNPDCTHGPDEPACTEGVQLDMSLRASDARTALVHVLHGWARVWDEERGPTDPTFADLIDTRIAALLATPNGQAALLRSQLNTIASAEWAPDMARDVHAAVREADRAIDRPPDTTVVGRCPECSVTLYGPQGASCVRCASCGATFDRLDVREASLAESRALLPAADLARVLNVPEGTVRSWRARGQLEVVRHDLAGRPLYRISDGQRLAAPVTSESA